MDFALGSHPAFEVARLGRRFRGVVPAIGCVARLFGFLSGYFRSEKRLVSEEFVRYLRAQESRKLREFIGACCRKRDSVPLDEVLEACPVTGPKTSRRKGGTRRFV